jgi:Second Messenger Oligonucleotide or Dinucleotide Synthetase domain
VQHIHHFNTFLANTVNLPKSRLVDLAAKVNALYTAVHNDDEYGNLVTGKKPQGSWAHRTIIKPKPDHEYDADVLLELDENPDWADDKKLYIFRLYSALGRARYPNRERRTRCVRVTYANDCHIDLVPYVDTSWYGRRIVNKKTGEWEGTNPDGFTDWMKQRDEWTTDHFRKVVRLMKYIRDHHGHFEGTRSIILTTLLGNRVDHHTKLTNPDVYGSVPRTLTRIVNDLDWWLRSQWGMPSVEDPSSPGTTFDHRWDETSYRHFRDRIHILADEMTDALDETSSSASLEKWQVVFGDEFGQDAAESKSASPFAALAGGAPSIGASTARPGRAG